MKIAHSPAQLERQPRAVAIGTFDGVHRGHRSVVQAAIDSGPRADGDHVRSAPADRAREPRRADLHARAAAGAARRRRSRGDAGRVVHDGADGARARGLRRAVPAGDRRRGGRGRSRLPLRLQAARRSRAARAARLRDPRGRDGAGRLVVRHSARPARRRRRRGSRDARPAVRARRRRRRGRPAGRHARLPDGEPRARAAPRLPALRHLRRRGARSTAPPSRSARTRTTAARSAGSSRTCSTSTATSTASGSSSRCGSGSATRRCSPPRRSSSPRSAATSTRPGRPSGPCRDGAERSDAPASTRPCARRAGSAAAEQRLGVDDADRGPGGEGVHLGERLPEVALVRLPGHVAEMRRREHRRVAARADRRSRAPRRTRRSPRCPGLPAASAASSAPRSISPARAVLTSSASGFISARCRPSRCPRVSGDSFRCRLTTSERAQSASRSGSASWPSARARSSDAGAAPGEHVHPERRCRTGDERADRPVADDAERPAVQLRSDRRLPGARPQRDGVVDEAAGRREDQRQRELRRGVRRPRPGADDDPAPRAGLDVDVRRPAAGLADQPQVGEQRRAAARRSASARG